jgi:hypothetical protein
LLSVFIICSIYESYGYNKSHVTEIEIIFSDGVLSADDIIAELVDESKNPYEITVVTKRQRSPQGSFFKRS